MVCPSIDRGGGFSYFLMIVSTDFCESIED